MRRTAWLMLLGLAVGCVRSDPPPTSEPPPAAEPDESLVVYSLEPQRRVGDDYKLEAGEVVFQRYLVIGSTTVTGSKIRELLEGVEKGIERDRLKRAICFEPRHGMRHTAKDGTVTEWLMCFECIQVIVTVQKAGVEVSREDYYLNHTPQKLLNDTLRTAGVKLAEGADKGE